MQLLGRGDARTVLAGLVEGGRLMRIFAVTHGLQTRTADGLALRVFIAELAGEPRRHRGVVGSGAGKRLGSQRFAQSQGRRAIGGNSRQHGVHAGLVDADADIGVVLGRRTDHGRTTDVDILDGGFEPAAGCHGRLERIEVDPDDVDAFDAVFLHRLGVFRSIAVTQQGAVHLGVQGLDAAIHHFREAGDVGDILDRQAGLLDSGARAAGRQQFDTGIDQGLGSFDQSGFVGQGNQGAFRGNTIGGGRKIGGGGHGISTKMRRTADGRKRKERLVTAG